MSISILKYLQSQTAETPFYPDISIINAPRCLRALFCYLWHFPCIAQCSQPQPQPPLLFPLFLSRIIFAIISATIAISIKVTTIVPRLSANHASILPLLYAFTFTLPLNFEASQYFFTKSIQHINARIRIAAITPMIFASPVKSQPNCVIISAIA